MNLPVLKPQITLNSHFRPYGISVIDKIGDLIYKKNQIIMSSRYQLPKTMLAKGKRVFIRKPNIKDEQEFIKKQKQSKKFHHPWIINNTKKTSYEAYLRRLELNNEGFFLCSKKDGAIIGVININEIVLGSLKSGYLGYYIFEPYSRQGFMKEGMHLVINYAFKKLKLHRLEANIQPQNNESIQLVKHCGLKKEGFSPRYLKIAGRWCDHERWAVLKEDYFLENHK